MPCFASFSLLQLLLFPSVTQKICNLNMAKFIVPHNPADKLVILDFFSADHSSTVRRKNLILQDIQIKQD